MLGRPAIFKSFQLDEDVMHFHYSTSPLDAKYRKSPWYNEIAGYLSDRYTSIEQRAFESFRYVEFDARNATTFSYEYSSLLRDIGSVFGSVMDKLLVQTGKAPSERRANILDYRHWLVSELPSLQDLSIAIGINRIDNILFPFADFKSTNSKIKWWDAYNDLKHSDIDQFTQGNFENVIDGMATLAGLLILLDRESNRYIRMFHSLGSRNAEGEEPSDLVQQRLFFK